MPDTAADKCGGDFVWAAIVEIREGARRDTDRDRGDGNRKHRRLDGDGLELVAKLGRAQARASVAREAFKIAQPTGVDAEWGNLAHERHMRAAATRRHLDAAEQDMQGKRLDTHRPRELAHALAHPERLGAGAQHEAAELNQCINGLGQRGIGR